MGSLAVRVENDPVDPNDSEDQSQNTQGSGQSGGKTEKQEADQSFERGRHRLDIENRHGRLEGTNQAGDFGYWLFGNGSRPDRTWSNPLVKLTKLPRKKWTVCR